MTSAPLTAESYHLKWDSHLMHLNLSVSTLYKHDRYADVMLLSSHPDCLGGPGVPAHKIILSTSSKFFANIFELTPHIPSHNGVMYLVLPPELSRRAIQVLVQYMYSGESTVSNDILNEVLNGGEILKIRGLYRGNAPGLSRHMNIQSPVINANLSSNQNNSIIKNAEKNISNQKFSSKTLGNNVNSFPERQFALSIKKDIAIDPDQRKLNIPLSPKNNIECTLTNRIPEPQFLSINTDCIPKHVIERRKSSIGSNFSDCLLQIKEEPNDSFSEKSQPFSLNFEKTKSSDHNIIDTECNSTDSSFIEDSKHEVVMENCDIKVQNHIVSDSEENSKSLLSDNCDDKVDSSNESETIIKQEFTSYLPKKRKKIQTESENEKKSISNKTKIDGVSGLKCDICHIAFRSPAVWVRHMQYHTETELAICNEKLKVEIKDESSWNITKSCTGKITKVCSYCKKSFASFKEMISHVRKEHADKE